MLSPKPLISRIRKRLGARDTIAHAETQIELAPAYVSDRPAAISLPGEFDRASDFFLGREAENLRVDGGVRREGATTATLLDDALIGDGAIYHRRSVDPYRDEAARLMLTGPVSQHGEAVLSTSKCAERFFADWLVEANSLALLAEERGLPAVSFTRPLWLHEPGYRDLLKLMPDPQRLARYERLWIVDDRGLNEYRAERLRELRRRVRSSAQGSAAGARLVYLARGVSGRKRDPLNASAVETELFARGFDIVRPESESALSLARKLSDAELVVSVEGSANAHALLGMADGGVLLTIQPPGRFTAPGKDAADMLALGYAFTVGVAAGTDYSVDMERLLKTIDLSLSR